ncbi:hypothetical protein V1515DRAFT_537723, partial [Lipomyces mesembrius]
LTAEQRADYEKQMKYIGLAKGASAGAALGLGFNYLAKSRFPVVYKSVTFRVATFMIPFIGMSRVGADRELSHAIYKERGVYQRQNEASKLSTSEKVMAFASKNRLSLIFGAWLTSLGVSGYVVSRDKLMTTAQKICQLITHCRMYAQGLTLALVVATAITTLASKDEPEYVPDPNDKHHHLIHNPHANHHRNEVDEHWKAVLEEEQGRKQ